MNIVIFTNSEKYPYHPAIAGFLTSEISESSEIKSCIQTLDIDAFPCDSACLKACMRFAPDIVITLDLAGFRFPTQSGECALNMLTTKNLNLIWGRKPEYSAYLCKKLSLSMRFYDVSGTDCEFPLTYPNMLYYKACDELYQEADTQMKQTSNRILFKKLWSDFLKEVLLFQA